MYEFQECRGRLFNTPLLITPIKAHVLADVLADRASWGRSVKFEDFAPTNVAASLQNAAPGGPEKVFPETDGVAIIHVRGTLVQRGGLDPYSGMTGYDGIATKLDAALHDPNIRAIVLDIDSPGGEVAGCFDLADRIFAARAVKPVWAILNEMAASAAYALASQADQIIMARTGMAGSVGVVTMHVDWSGALDKDGVTVTLIHGGAKKVDANPYAPLPEGVQASIQAEIDTLHKWFAEIVARGRDLKVADVMATEAQTYLGPAAQAVGFVDAVMAPEDGFQALLDALAGTPVQVSA